MVIPSSGGSWDAGRENALRACSLSARRAAPCRTAPHRVASRRAASRRNAPGRAGGQETPPSHPAEEMPEQTRWKKRDEMGDKLDFLQGMGRDAARR